MQSNNGNQTLIILVACVGISAMVSLAAVLIAVQRPVVVVVQQGAADQAATASAATGDSPTIATASLDAGPGSAAPSAGPTDVTAVRVAAAPSLDDPFDSAWDDVPATEVQLLPQQVATPMLERATVPRLRVQAARDDGRIVWRLSWNAAQPSSNVETSRFTDAVAVQFPLVEGAPFTMGAKGQPVTVLQWKALWQKDIDQGFQDVHVLYPNARSDLYWFASGDWPYPVEEAFKDPRSRDWLVGIAAQSPTARIDRTEPIEELVAEGFGTTTNVPDTISSARGQWRDRRWTVVIDRPLTDADPLAVALRPGGLGQIAFAVWDGQADNVGGRKHYVGWIPFKVEP